MYTNQKIRTTPNQCFSDAIVSPLEVVYELLHDGLGVGVITHGIEQINGSHTNTDITFTLREEGGGDVIRYMHIYNV